MHQVQLPERLYKEAERRAVEAGFANVDEYVAQVVGQDLAAEAEDFDFLFTPERLAQFDPISAEIKAGAKTYSMDEVGEHFEKRGDAWRRQGS
jgi:hypothetical protein